MIYQGSHKHTAAKQLGDVIQTAFTLLTYARIRILYFSTLVQHFL